MKLSLLLVASFGIIVLLSLPSSLSSPFASRIAHATFSGYNDLSINSGNSESPKMAMSGSNLYVAWQDATTFNGETDIFFRKSIDNGTTFDAVINLSNNSGLSFAPIIAAAGSNVYVVWVDFTPGNDEIFFARSTDGGAVFTAPVNLSNNNGSSFEPTIAVAGSKVYVVWADSTAGNDEIFYSRSTDSGASFEAVKNLSNDAGTSFSPQIAVAGSKVYVVWVDYTPPNHEIFFKRSTDGGATFGSTTNLSNNPGNSFLPSMAASGSNVHVVWDDNSSGNYEILYGRSTDSGASFAMPVDLSLNTGDSTGPQLVISKSNVFVAWQDNTPGNYEILFKRSTNSGSSFGATLDVSNTPTESGAEELAVSGSSVYVVWTETVPGQDEIFSARSLDGGASFGCALNLSNNSGNSLTPVVVASIGGVYIVWSDDTPGNYEIFFDRNVNSLPSFCLSSNLSNNKGDSFDPEIAVVGANVFLVWVDNTPANQEIFFARSTNNGAAFNVPANLSSDLGDSNNPQIVASGTNVYVAWEDNTLGNGEIYFKKSIDNGATFGSTINLSHDSGESFQARIGVSGSNVSVFWVDDTSGNNEILYRRSTNFGGSFGSTVNLSNDKGSSLFPKITVAGTNLYVVWQNASASGSEIFYKRSTDGGVTFGGRINLSNNAGDSSRPEIAAAGSRVYVVWSDSTPGNPEIFYRRSTDSGASFGNTTNLSKNSGISNSPQILVSGKKVYVTWDDSNPGNFDILYKMSSDNGVTFGSTINLSKTPGTSFGQHIAVSGTNVFVTWNDNTPGNYEILFKVSTNGGTSFASTINLSNNPGNSFNEQIATSASGRVYVVWHDNSAGNTEIFLRASY